MLQILAITTPIYLIIAAGYLSVRFGLFNKPDMRVLGRFVINFCLPALIFNALSKRPLGEVLNGPYLLAYAAGSLTVVLIGMLVGLRLRRQSMPLATMQSLGMAASNSGFVGYPIVLQLLGPTAGVALALTMVVENLLVLPLCFAMADNEGQDAAQRWHHTLAVSLRNLLKNPMVLAILAGFGFSLSGLHLPAVLAQTVQIVATASSPVALFVIGGSLVGLKLAGVRRDLAWVACGKLLLHPLAVFTMLWLLPAGLVVAPELRVAAVLFAAMPMLSIYPVVAQKYGLEGFTAAALLVATVSSFFTISSLLWAMHHLLGWVA
ncbi:MAG: AEC family transporter [Burkholderiales bacterium]|nr:AEC family transporter [Burkholderiales bacterium]